MYLSVGRHAAKWAVAPLLASAIVALAGCASQGVGTGAADSSAASVAPASTGSSADGADTSPSADDWTVSAAGVGPLRLGRTFRDLATDPGIGLTGSLEKCATAFVAKPGYRFAVSFPAGEYGDDAAVPTVQSVTVTASGSGTGAVRLLGAAGVTLGSSSSIVEAAYPGGSWGSSGSQTGIDRIYVVDQGPITFGFANGALAAISVGARDISTPACG